MSRREYKSGSKFAFWRWKDIVSNGELYLRRLHLLQTPVFSIFVHWIKKPDDEVPLHDHPISFLSIVLKGWYREQRAEASHYVRWFNLIRANTAHRILEVSNGGVVTLVLSGSPRRTWGFHTPQGWVSWRDYYKGVTN